MSSDRTQSHHITAAFTSFISLALPEWTLAFLLSHFVTRVAKKRCLLESMRSWERSAIYTGTPLLVLVHISIIFKAETCPVALQLFLPCDNDADTPTTTPAPFTGKKIVEINKILMIFAVLPPPLCALGVSLALKSLQALKPYFFHSWEIWKCISVFFFFLLSWGRMWVCCLQPFHVNLAAAACLSH